MNHPLKTSSVVLALGLLTAAATASGQSASSNDASQTINKSDALEQVVVTAQRYRSTIQDTPISISALSGDQLVASGISTVSDVAHDIPGLSMRSAGPGLTEFEARGLASTGGAAPTVGFYLDEVPLSPPALSQSGKIVIDPDLYDVDRVEVLRGPQGTLYGSGSMGGTIKIVTNQPKIGVFEGSAQRQIILQMSNALQGIIAQELLPAADRTRRVLAYELIVANGAVRNLIRENQVHQLENTIQTGRKEGMTLMDNCLYDLYCKCLITYDTAVSRARHPDRIIPQKT